MYENILVDREEAIGIITINRPGVLNALNKATVREIGEAMDELIADDGVRVIIMTGAGEKSFVAGSDINELRAVQTAAEGEARSQRTQGIFFKIDNSPKPVIMAVNGYAFGGGCELALSGDIRIAADTARFGQLEINLGLIPGAGGTQRLPRLVGRGMATLMILTGEIIDAQEALRIGLVERVVPAAELMPVAKKVAGTIAAKAPLAVRAALKSIDAGMRGGLQSGCALESSQFGLICGTEDRVEGTAAFLEKRKPEFKGR
ncbi:MAG: enoyl-CoA hydratase/isomerase family protein [Chloroflexi bacterium]|nr:enoyl-CoA hydratase/isomerase family protein [Chloroflexota bacterium]